MDIDDHIGLTLQNYSFLSVIGEGCWGKIFQTCDMTTYDLLANILLSAKIIKRSRLNSNPTLMRLVENEISILRQCNNPNIVKFFDSFETEDFIYIVMEYCRGGTLQEYVETHEIQQTEAVSILKQLLNGFKGLHEVGAMHRDFKAANVLIDNGVFKICDLGFSKITDPGKLNKTVLGTPEIMAPEILQRKPYSFKADVWSLGVVYYFILNGRLPYFGFTFQDMLDQIQSKQIKYSRPISELSKSFIEGCLTFDPEKRLDWKDIYQHPLIKGTASFFEISFFGDTKLGSEAQANRDFYRKTVLVLRDELTNPQSKKFLTLPPSMKQLPASALKEDQSHIRHLQKVSLFKHTNQVREKCMTELLLKKNQIISLIKFGVDPMVNLPQLLVKPTLYAFLISKKAWFQMLEFCSILQSQIRIVSGVSQEQWQSFLESPTHYVWLLKKVSDDCEALQAMCLGYSFEISTSRQQVRKQLDLGVRVGFEEVFVSNLKQYAQTLSNPQYSLNVKDKLVLKRLVGAIYLIARNLPFQISPQKFQKTLSDTQQYHDAKQVLEKLSLIYT